MPNWCANIVIFKHPDAAKVKAAAEAYENAEFLQHVCPNPSGEWNFDWSVENWGTKWDIGEPDGVDFRDDNSFQVTFESAWAPPTVAYEKMVEDGWEIDAFYYEPGIGFCGRWTDGVDDYHDFTGMDSQEVADTIPLEVDEAFGISESMAEYEDENREELTEWLTEGAEQRKTLGLVSE